MKTLQISEQKALELHPNASNEFKQLLEENFGKDLFKPKDMTELVYNIETLAKHLNVNEEKLFIFDRNTQDKHQRFINACNILPIVAKVYNQYFPLDWTNTNQAKHLPYLNFSGVSGAVVFFGWYYRLDGPSGFYYKSGILARKSYQNFKQYWEDYWGYKS